MSQSRNYIRAEVNRMKWPQLLTDEDGDIEREIARLHRRLSAWRAFALFLVAALVVLMIFDMVIGG